MSDGPASRFPPRRGLLVFATALLLPAALQDPGPADASRVVRDPATTSLDAGRRLLTAEDPIGAWQSFRAAAAAGPVAQVWLGLGEAHLMLGRPGIALQYADGVARAWPLDADAHALRVRALLRARRFDDAFVVASTARARIGERTGIGELLAAQGSALFRLQHVEAAIDAYRAALHQLPDHAEAFLRLGSGLLPPPPEPARLDLDAAVKALDAGLTDAAIGLLRPVVAAHPNEPVPHRLMGEALYLRAAQNGMAASAPEFAYLASALPTPDVSRLPVADFLPQFAALTPDRRRVAARSLALFGSLLPRLVTIGGRHDLLLPLERTTDAPSRTSLRGKRTFDGRVWDDVRGIGGLRAATGIEALDETAQFGFDTLSHEIAHQAHLYGFRASDRRRVRQLYEQAKGNDRFLDYYAATNETEYFAQGVEAFVSYGKRPGREVTHGHTRFELFRVDRALHDFVATMVDVDPLRDPATRVELLRAAIAVALRTGRPEDAEIAADWLPPGPERDVALAVARRAIAASTPY